MDPAPNFVAVVVTIFTADNVFHLSSSPAISRSVHLTRAARLLMDLVAVGVYVVEGGG